MKFLFLILLLTFSTDTSKLRSSKRNKPDSINFKTSEKFINPIPPVRNGNPINSGANYINNISQTIYITQIISVLSSIATLVTAFFTYLLLRQTQKTLALNVETNKREGKRLEAEMVNLVYRNFRETYMSMVNDKQGLKVLSETHSTSQTEVKTNMFGSFLINNVHQMFDLKQRGFISEQEWAFYLVDIKEFFEYEFIKTRWNKISDFYPTDFNKFVQQIIS